jgi:hypothetical protein
VPTVVIVASTSASLDGDGMARLSHELSRLDPYTFWTIPAGARSAGDLIVVGQTGVFLVAAWPALGAFSVSLGRPVVDGRSIPGLSALRSDAKHLTSRLSGASVPAKAEPVVCLTHAAIGMPREVKGIRFVQISGLLRDLTERPKVLELTRVQRAARLLGVEIPGDRNRHFA